MYYFVVSLGKESERGLAEFLWLKVSYEVVVKLLARIMISFEGPVEEMGDLPPSLFTHFFCPLAVSVHRATLHKKSWLSTR